MVHTNLPFFYILSQINPINAQLFQFLKICFSISNSPIYALV